MTHSLNTTSTALVNDFPAASVPASNPRTPTHHAYHVREFTTGEGKKSLWTRVGTAWAHRDGQGFNLQLDCTPVDGRLSLRVATEKKE